MFPTGPGPTCTTREAILHSFLSPVFVKPVTRPTTANNGNPDNGEPNFGLYEEQHSRMEAEMQDRPSINLVSTRKETKPRKQNGLGVFLIICCLFCLETRPTDAQCTSGCDIVAQALAEVGQIKAGTTRKDVEQWFQVDGGASFRFDTAYVYTKCKYLKVTVHFLHSADEAVSPSPNDIVESVSELTVGLENKD
jgi:hypothetical protein